MSSAAALQTLAKILIAIALVAITAGLAAILIRPFWLLILSFALSAGTIPLYLGTTTTLIAITAVYMLSMILYAFSVKKKLENQIKFSIHPLADAQKILLILLVVIVSAAFALGYMSDALRRNFIVPPEVKTKVNASAVSFIEKKLENEKMPIKEKKAVIENATKKIQEVWTELDTRLKDNGKNIIAILLGITAFTTLQCIMMFTSWIPSMILACIFPLLKVTHIAQIVMETVEAERLVL